VMGLELVKDKRTKELAPKLIRPFIVDCANHGLLVGSVGLYKCHMRCATFGHYEGRGK
jgi:4-aminobutyrate aminotransferase-like enzyme